VPDLGLAMAGAATKTIPESNAANFNSVWKAFGVNTFPWLTERRRVTRSLSPTFVAAAFCFLHEQVAFFYLYQTDVGVVGMAVALALRTCQELAKSID
jgi:hypothetical protein